MEEIPVWRSQNTNPWLTSTSTFDHSYRAEGGLYVYYPDHALPVVLVAKDAPICTDRGTIIPIGYSAIVTLIRHGGSRNSDWSIRLYQGLDAANNVALRSDHYQHILRNI